MIAHAIFTLTDRVNVRTGVAINSIWKFVQTKYELNNKNIFYANLKRAADEEEYVLCPDKKNLRYKLTKKFREFLVKKVQNGDTDLNVKRMHDMLKPTKPKGDKPTKVKKLQKNKENKTKKGKETRKKVNDKKADAKQSKRSKKLKQDAKDKKTKERGDVDNKKIVNERKKKANEKGSKANKKSVNDKKQKVENIKKSIKAKNETKTKRVSNVS